MSLRDRILSASDIQTTKMHIEAWGVDLEIRTITAVERSRLIAECTRADNTIDMEKMYPLLLIAGVYDPDDGSKVFTTEDIAAIQDKSASAVEQVAQEVMRLSGMNGKAVDAEGKSN